MPKPSELIPEALRGMIPPDALAAMDQEAVEAEAKQKVRDELLATLVKEFGIMRDEVNMLKAKVGIV